MKIFAIILFVTVIVSTSDAVSEIFSRTNNAISINLYKELIQSEPGNFVYGIFPLDAIIALTYFGTKGDTARQIKSVFVWNASDEQIINDFESSIKELESIPHFKVHTFNRIYVTNRYDVNPAFLEKASHFDTNIVKVNFGAAKQTADNINSWASNRTHPKNKNWIGENVINSQTDLVLVSNIDLRGKWMHRFEKKATTEMDFHVSKNETVKVKMMKVSGYFMVSRHPSLGIKMLKLPYKNDKVYMVVVLADDIDAVDSIGHKADQLWGGRNFTSEYITVYLPKFEVTSTIDMIPTLTDMGVTKLFSKADLSGINEKAVNVSVITQKIHVDVDERGTVADDSPEPEGRSPTKSSRPNEGGSEFKVDHPFVFGILYDNDLGLIFGRITRL